jgi:mRNA-degrading endonuclease RelE of RelBE toxin-antitoxin system
MANPKSVRLSNRAEKALESIDVRFKERLKEAIRELSRNPLLGKKLKGALAGLRSYRVGSFRIVYRFNKELLEVVYIDDRKDVYR